MLTIKTFSLINFLLIFLEIWLIGRCVVIHEGEDDLVLRMVESESILAYSNEKPDDAQMSGSSVGDYAPDNIDPSGFVNAN